MAAALFVSTLVLFVFSLFLGSVAVECVVLSVLGVAVFLSFVSFFLF